MTVPFLGPKFIFVNCSRAETSLDLLCLHTKYFLRLNVLLFPLPVKLLLSFHKWFKYHVSDLCSKKCSFGYKLLKKRQSIP